MKATSNPSHGPRVALVVLAASGFPLGLAIIYLTWWNTWSWVGAAIMAFSPMVASRLAGRFFSKGETRPAAARYARRCAAIMVAYFVLFMGAVIAYDQGLTEGPLGYLIALGPAIPIVLILVMVARYLKEESDEVARAMMLQSLVWSGGFTLAESTVWGFLETFDKVPNVWMWVVPVAFFAQWGIATPLVARAYR